MTLRAIYIAPGSYQNLIEMERSLVDSVSGMCGGVIFTGTGLSLTTITDFQVTATTGHNVLVNVGRAIVRDKTNAFIRGSYLVEEDNTETYALPVPDTSPFIATVVLRVTNPEYGSVTGTVGPRIDIIKGTPASSPVAVSDSFISAVTGTPGGWLRLSDIRINTGDSGAIPAGQFTDKRTPSGFGRVTSLSTCRPANPTIGMQCIDNDTGFTFTYGSPRPGVAAVWDFDGAPKYFSAVAGTTLPADTPYGAGTFTITFGTEIVSGGVDTLYFPYRAVVEVSALFYIPDASRTRVMQIDSGQAMRMMPNIAVDRDTLNYIWSAPAPGAGLVFNQQINGSGPGINTTCTVKGTLRPT